MRRLCLFSLGLVLVTVVVTGCGPARRPTVKTTEVSGTVKLDGSPLGGAEINFLAEKYAGVATTDANGHYEIEAQPGPNTVYVRKYEGAGPDFDETMIAEGDTGGAGGPKQLVPAKYSNPSKTELKFTVPDAGSKNADFDLSSK